MHTPDKTDADNPPMPAKNLRATVALVADRTAPLQVGDFEVDDNGRLRPRTDGSPLAFGFSYRGVDFIATLHTEAEARVSLRAELGKLPYSAEVGARRRLVRRIVEATGALPRGRIHLSEDQDMHLSAEAPAPQPLTPARVMATVAALLLDFRPYLDLMHLAALSNQFGSGTTKICPG